ncbi:MAG: DUF4340 domain-containing protein [Chloroflexota bacterium]
MNARTTLILLIVLAVLGGYVYLFELEGNNSGGDEPPAIWGTPYSEYDIVELEIFGPASIAHFARTQETLTQDWAMLQPSPLAPDQLDQARVNGAATRLGQLTASQVITGVTNLAQYGLDPPELTTTLTISNGQKITLYAGAVTPLDENRYLQINSDPQSVYLVFGFAVDDLLRLLAGPPLKPARPVVSTPATAP